MPLHNIASALVLFFQPLKKKKKIVLNSFPLSENQLVSVNGGPLLCIVKYYVYELENTVKEHQSMFPALENQSKLCHNL